MSAHKKRDRVRFEYQSAAVDPEYGTPIPGQEWLPFAEVWAEIQDVMPSKSTESTEHGLRLGKELVRIRVNHRNDLTSAMRVVELTGRQRTLSIIGGPASIFMDREIEILTERFTS